MRNIFPKTDPAKDFNAGKQRAASWLSVRRVDDYLKFVVFVTVIGVFYIANAHFAEQQIKNREKLKTEVKALKAEYMMRKADLASVTRYTNLVVNMDSIGLQRLKEAPYKLIKKKKK